MAHYGWPMGVGSTVIYYIIIRFHLLLHFIPYLALKVAGFGRFTWANSLAFCLEAPGASWEMDKRPPWSV